MRTSEVAQLFGVTHGRVANFARAVGIDRAIGSRDSWSPGDALALWIVRELDGKPRFADGARKCGEALDSGYPPAYLITRGGEEYVVVIESESPAQTDEMVASLLLQANDAGAVVRVVRLRPMVARLAPWLAELELVSP